jgi:hypothetical protein
MVLWMRHFIVDMTSRLVLPGMMIKIDTDSKEERR